MVKFLDFCSGIGAGRLGLENNGFECVGFSEILKTSIDTYKHFFDTKKEKELGDLTKLSMDEIPQSDIMIAGFPCQAFSIQGLRQGFNDERGQIIFYLKNILEKKNIKYFIFENVKGLVNHNNGKTIKAIVKLLEEAGYKVFYKILTSNDYGLPQKRERVYFVGIRNDLPFTDYIFPKPYQKKSDLKNFLIETDDKYLFNRACWLNKYMNNKYNKGKFDLDDLLKRDYLIIDTRQSDMRLFENYAPTLRTGRSGILYIRDNQIRCLSGKEGLLLQGFPVHFFEKAGVFSSSLLLQQTGNAMSVNVIEAIAKELKKIIILNGDVV